MPKIIVEIEYDKPSDPYWMNPDNVSLCLHKYCPNTKFKVKWARDGDPWSPRKPDYGILISIDNDKMGNYL